MKKSLLYICSIIFLLSSFSFLLPNHYDPWRTAYQDFLMFLVFIVIFLNIFINQKNILIDRKILGVFLFSIIPILQFLFGKIYFFGDALLASIYIFSFGCAILVGFNIRQYLDIEKILKFLCFILLFSAFISIYITLKQWLLLTNGGIWMAEVPIGGRPFANFAQPNNCASFLVISVIAVLYIYEKRIINKFTGSLLAFLILFCLALTQSRSVWLFAVCFFIWWFWKTKNLKMRLKRFSLFYFLIFFIISALSISFISNILGILSTTDVITRATTGHLRIPMWHQMLLAISKEPLWGYGWNQVSVAQLSVYLEYPILEWTEHSHNIILDLLIWNGIPIGILIITFFSMWLWRLSLLAKSLEVFITLSMIGVLVVHAMLEFPLEYAFFLLPLGLLLGIVYFNDKDIKVIKIPRSIGISFWCGLIILYIWIFIEYRIIEKDVQLVSFELMNMGDLHSESDAPNVILLTQLRERVRFLRTEPVSYMSKDQLDWMKKITYRYGTSNNLYRYSQALALNNQFKSAEHHLTILNGLYQRKNTMQSLYIVNKSLAYEWSKKQVSKP